MAQSRRLVLASTSAYRRELLARLKLEFEVASPGIDEAALPNESPADGALRLAYAKARAVAPKFPDALVIGSDQVASCEGERLGKPGNHANAVRQLTFLSARTARFDTAVALLDAQSGREWTRLVGCEVAFRKLSPALIEDYLRKERPYDCAGSAKSEGLGIALIAAMKTDDPTSLIGLPLIALSEMLAEAGLPVLG